MRIEVRQPVFPQLLRQEIADRLGLETAPHITYNPAEGWVEVDLDDPEVPSIVAGHTADGTALWPEWKRRLYEDLLVREDAPHSGSTVESLMERYVLEQMKNELGRMIQ